MAQKASFQLGLAIDRHAATMPPRASSVWAALECPSSVQAARRALLTAKDDLAALGIPKDALRAQRGAQAAHHGKYDIVRAHMNLLVHARDRPLRKS